MGDDIKPLLERLLNYAVEGKEHRARLEAKFDSLEEITKTNTEQIGELEHFKIKWEGFKWAWALIFSTVGAMILALFKWLAGGVLNG